MIQYDELHEGETISFVVPVDLNDLTSGVDAILLKNIRLDYTDENNNARIKTPDKVTLPVIGSDGKITNQVSTDKATYYEHENVSIFDRIHNNSDIRAAKGLTNVISIIDTVGIEKFQVTTIDRYSKLYGQAFLIWGVLVFFQKAVDFFNRIVYNKIARYLSLYKSSLTEENIYG